MTPDPVVGENMILLRDVRFEGVPLKRGTILLLVQVTGQDVPGKLLEKIYDLYPLLWIYHWNTKKNCLRLRRSEFIPVSTALLYCSGKPS